MAAASRSAWRDLLQAGQKDQGAGAEPPQAQEDQRRFRPGRVGQPAHRGQSNLLEQGVDEPVIGVEHGDKDDGAGNGGDEHGQGDERAVDTHTLRARIQEQRQAQRAGQTEGNGEQGVIRTVPDRRPERRVGGEHGAVVLQANPPGGLDDVVVGKGQVQRREHRIGGEQQQAEQPWQHKQQPGTGRAAPRPTPPRLLCTSGRHAMFLVYEPACSTLSSAPWQAFCASARAFLGVATLCMICSSARLI